MEISLISDLQINELVDLASGCSKKTHCHIPV